ncbi:ACT domain-containing protein [Halanaerocella petrolearia]
MNRFNLSLEVLENKFAIWRLNKESSIPEWIFQEDFFSVTKTDDEVSIICNQDKISSQDKVSMNWRGLKVAGPLDFSLTGILASLTDVLAEAEISVFAFSTYDTDYLLVKDKDLEEAIETLERKGYKIEC